ncbi:hypothetical protein HK098_002472 [Nowakowskiella sp. JEL0407]|nr:hypothetical protein HK098_002472 [Nowakowskiella sp. JEL0407]
MKFSAIANLAVTFFCAVSSALPAPSPASSPSAQAAGVPSDVDVLNFACLLEDLENKFYRECTTKFSKSDYEHAGFKGALFDQFLLINDHENTHFITLQTTIIQVFGKEKLQPECALGCEYNFPIHNPHDCVNLAGILERTGVSAYDGAIRFVENPDLKNAGAAIATIEGRHAAFLNLAQHKLPVPNAFDTPLGVRPIFSLAAQFVKKCPRDIPIVPFPLITVDGGNGDVGQHIRLEFEADVNDNDLKGSKVTFVFGLAQKNVSPVSIRRLGGKKIEIIAQVPQDVEKFGEVTLFIVNQDKPVSVADDTAVIAGPGTLIREKVVVEVVNGGVKGQQYGSKYD